MDKLALDCSKCGGALEITPDMEVFKCPFCGVPYMVEREEGTVRVIRLEQRVRVLEEKQSTTDKAVSEISARQELLDTDLARMELAKLREERRAYTERWKKENPTLIGAVIGAVVLAFGAVFCVSAFSIVEFNDTTGPIAFFVCPPLIGVLAAVGWLSRLAGYRRGLQAFDRREQELYSRMGLAAPEDRLRAAGQALRDRRQQSTSSE